MDFKYRKFDSRVKAGTKVLVEGLGWCVVKTVHRTRKWIQVIQVNGWVGTFQRGRVLKFTNK